LSFPAYPEYKDSGVEWLGEVPAGWAVSPLKRFLSRNDGGVWGDDPDGENETVVLRSTEQAVDGRWQIEEPATRTLNSRERDSALLRVGDLVVTKSSGSSLHIGKTSLVDEAVATLGACYSNFMQRLRVSSDCNPRFVWFVMNNPIARGQFDLLSNSTTGLANLNATILGEVRLAFPSPDEQRQIVDFLDRETVKIDAAVAAQERLIALLAEKRAATISHAVTKGLDPDAPMKDSGIEWLAHIPAHWETRRTGRMLTHRKNLVGEQADEYDLLSLTLRGIIRRDMNNPEGKFPASFVTYQEVEPGDLVFCLFDVDETPRTVGLSEFPGMITGAYDVFTPSDALLGRWLYRFYLHHDREKSLKPFYTGLRKVIRTPTFKSIPLPVPPRDEMESILDKLDAMEDEFQRATLLAKSSIRLLKERRAALIAAAVTGKIDVRGDVTADNVVSLDEYRASVGAVAIAKLGKMGRMAVMKAGYLAEAYAGMHELRGHYERNAAGPYCSSVVRGMERGAGDRHGITVRESEGKASYDLPVRFEVPAAELRDRFGIDRANRFLSLMTELSGFSREGVEAIATLYAAWNDLLANAGEVSDDAVHREVLDNWHPEKRDRFNAERLAYWMDWMRRNGVVPDGTAPRTDHQDSLI
tara:strand:+ start:5210 stop:7135 length:1926 start_codon:yes stop_codon:yes gene_type:complete